MKFTVVRVASILLVLLLALEQQSLSAAQQEETAPAEKEEGHLREAASSEAPGSELEPGEEEDPDAALLQALPQLETVVTADRSEERAFESIRAIEALGRDQIDRRLPDSVPDALRDLPGLHLQETNRGAGSPILRGRVGPDNLIIVDGVRFNTSTFRTGPNQYLSTLDLYAAERIEVLRGPSSVLYGNGALGGVIHVITRTPDLSFGPPHLSGSARGSFSSADWGGGAGARLSGGVGPLAALGGLNFSSLGDLRAGGGFVQPHTGYQRRGWHAKLVYQPRSEWEVTGAHLGSKILDAGRTDLVGRGEVRFYDNTDHLTYVAAKWRGFGLLREVRTGFSFHRLLEEERRLICAPGVDVESCLGLNDAILARRRRGEDTVTSLGADIYARASFLERRLEIIAGADAYRDLVESFAERAESTSDFVFEPLPRGSFSDGSTYLTLGGFVHGRALLHDRGPGAPKLRLEGGGRASAFIADAPAVPSVGDVQYRHTGLVGSGGLQYYRPGSYNIYASFMQGFRAPNLQETTVLGSTGSKFEIPNDDLRPERSDTLELGAKLQLGRAVVQAAVYRSYLVDAIDEEPASWNGETEVGGAPVVRRVNAAAGIYEGVEVGAAIYIWRFRLAGAATWTRGQLSTGTGEAHPARRVPPLFGTVTAGYHGNERGFFTELGLSWAARQDRLHPSDRVDPRICGLGLYRTEIDESCEGTPGYATIDLRVGARPTPWSRIMLVAGNLGDVRYRTHGSGFDAAGLGLRAMVEMEY